MSYASYTHGTHGAFNAPPAETPTKRRASGLGAAGLLLGGIAFLFAWVPLLGLIMIVPAAFAVVLGVLGFAKGTVTGKTRRGMPFMATLVGTSALLVAPAATVVGTMAAVPWGVRVASDQVEIELEHGLKQNGVAADRAARISAEVGEAMRHFAQPTHWREGIAAAHRFGLLVDDYERAVRTLQAEDERRAELTEQFAQGLVDLAHRYDIELATGDIRELIKAKAAEKERRQSRFERCNIPPAPPIAPIAPEAYIQFPQGEAYPAIQAYQYCN